MVDPHANVLVINVARIGDTLLSTPALKAIKATCPAGKLHVIGHPRRMEVLANLHFIDYQWSITKKSAPFRGRLSLGKPFDWAFVFGNDTALVRYALRVSRRTVAFRQADERLNHRLMVVEKPATLLHAVAERLLPIRAAGIEATDVSLSYAVSPVEAWTEHIPPHSGPVIGLQLASFPAKAYRDWPLEHFRTLIARICSHYPNACFVALGDHHSKLRAEELRQAFPERVIVTAGAFSLRQSAAVMARLNLYIGVDTGPTHLAGALGIPMVALYHCFHRGRHLAPLGHPALRVVEHPRGDEGCSRETGMEEITPDTVWSQVENLLSQTYSGQEAGGASPSTEKPVSAA